jgi:hypothetical protein
MDSATVGRNVFKGMFKGGSGVEDGGEARQQVTGDIFVSAHGQKRER